MSMTMTEHSSRIHARESVETPWAWYRAVNDILTSPPFTEPLSFPIQIYDWLYLSDMPSVSDVRNLVTRRITHVLTTNIFWSEGDIIKLKERLAQHGIEHCAVSGEDEEGYDMLGNHWGTCREFIQQARSQDGGKIVVHCAAGQNRSGLIVAAAMLSFSERNDERKRGDSREEHGLTSGTRPYDLLYAVRRLKQARGIVITNLSFQRQLCIFAAENKCLGDKPKEYSDEPIPETTFRRQPLKKSARCLKGLHDDIK